MVVNSQNKGLSITPEAELAKIAEQTTLEQEKAGVVAATKDTLGRFGAVFALTAALTAGNPAAAVESPFLPIADGSRNFPLVLKDTENPKIQAELFSAFDRNNKSEKRELFASLPSDKQKKVLGYYKAASEEEKQTGKPFNEKAVLKGVYNLISYYTNLKINEDALEQYKQTGNLPNNLPTVSGNALMVTQ